jgi:hypothetical protein
LHLARGSLETAKNIFFEPSNVRNIWNIGTFLYNQRLARNITRNIRAIFGTIGDESRGAKDSV